MLQLGILARVGDGRAGNLYGFAVAAVVQQQMQGVEKSAN